MRTYILLGLLSFLMALPKLQAQNAPVDVNQYLEANQMPLSLDNEHSPSEEHRIFLFGAIHGTQLTQEADLILLKKHVESNRVRIYLSEIDGCLAFFLNTYLETGNPKVLREVVDLYKDFVPQDASVEFLQKWEAIYDWNAKRPKSQRIKVMGAEPLLSEKLALRMLRALNKKAVRSNQLIRSILKVNQVPEDTTFILTGNEIETVYTPLVRNLLRDWNADPQQYRGLFGSEYWQFALLMKNIERNLNPNDWEGREAEIFENLLFLDQLVDLKKLGVYGHYGFTHLLQAPVNDFLPLAGLLNEHSRFQGVVYSYLGLLSNCEVLWERKYDKAGQYIGFKVTSWQDGDNLFEKQAGLRYLRKIAATQPLTLFELDQPDSPFNKELWFVNASRGKRLWRVEANRSTLDYIQAVVLVQNSPANTPIEEMERSANENVR